MGEKKSNHLINSLKLPAVFIILITAIQIFSSVLGLELGVYGTYPRDLTGFRGVFFSPLLHSGWPHLLSNAPPLFILSSLILYFFPRIGKKSIAMMYILTGVAVWLFARSVFHIGASGVVYALVAFVFWSGIFRKNVKSMALGLIVMFYYGSLFMGILPGQEGISWESHLFGGLVGIFVAYWFKGDIEKDEEKKEFDWEKEDNTPVDNFLTTDVFDKTKAERLQEEREQNDNPTWFSNY